MPKYKVDSIVNAEPVCNIAKRLLTEWIAEHPNAVLVSVSHLKSKGWPTEILIVYEEEE